MIFGLLREVSVHPIEVRKAWAAFCDKAGLLLVYLILAGGYLTALYLFVRFVKWAWVG